MQAYNDTLAHNHGECLAEVGSDKVDHKLRLSKMD
jgi:hypothetical protein